MLWPLMQKTLFSLEAETAHNLSSWFLRRVFSITPQMWSGLLRSRAPTLPTQAAGLSFLNPLGLAAGFDKNAHLLEVLPYLGFGFAEIGTVTLHPQRGNARPRLFRKPDEKLLFNRMGFNSEGAGHVSDRLKRVKPKLPQDFRVGVNLGKNKDTLPEQAADEYAVCASFFEGIADYFTINISSPNTPGLRDLQSAEYLQKICTRVQEVVKHWKPIPPLFFKFAPELATDELVALVRAGDEIGASGYVLTNTLAGNWKSHSGGWSGPVLKERSSKALQQIRSQTKSAIISVGGIDTVEEARRRMDLGANLIQIYTAWIYEGPQFPRRIIEGL